MSKVEDRATDLGYGTDPLNRAEYTANEVREAFIEGYHQAEKDNELTWKDLALIRLAFDATESNINHGSLKISKMTKEYYQEVLKRFKDLKK